MSDSSRPSRRHVDIQIDELRSEVRELRERLDPVIEMWETAAGFIRVLNGMARFAKWVAALIAPVIAIYTLVKLGLFKHN